MFCPKMDQNCLFFPFYFIFLHLLFSSFFFFFFVSNIKIWKMELLNCYYKGNFLAKTHQFTLSDLTGCTSSIKVSSAIKIESWLCLGMVGFCVYFVLNQSSPKQMAVLELKVFSFVVNENPIWGYSSDSKKIK